MENFAEQKKAEDTGDNEATSADLEFVRAMEYGMPIQAGFGMGIERIIAILTGQDNLRDVVMFPLMKPENQEKKAESKVPLSKGMSEGQGIVDSKSCLPMSHLETKDPHSDITIDLTTVENTLSKYSTTTKEHNLTVGRCMRYFANKL